MVDYNSKDLNDSPEFRGSYPKTKYIETGSCNNDLPLYKPGNGYWRCTAARDYQVNSMTDV